jgi:hypothetical protein
MFTLAVGTEKHGASENRVPIVARSTFASKLFTGATASGNYRAVSFPSHTLTPSLYPTPASQDNQMLVVIIIDDYDMPAFSLFLKRNLSTPNRPVARVRVRLRNIKYYWPYLLVSYLHAIQREVELLSERVDEQIKERSK